MQFSTMLFGERRGTDAARRTRAMQTGPNAAQD